MKIALLAPFEEPVPPEKYGGTERVIYSLADKLVSLGHDVTLLASGDSKTPAKLVPCVKTSLRSYIEKDQRTWYYLNWQGFHEAIDHLSNNHYDIVHNHGDWPFLIASAYTNAPIVTTIHNPIQFKFGVKKVYTKYKYISISDAQRQQIPELDYAATIHNGIDVQTFEFNDQPKDYLAFLAGIRSDKGPEQAIQIAKKTNEKLIMAGKVDATDLQYFKDVIEPLIDGQQIAFIGEIDHAQKVELLKNAAALLAPIQWDEPFGLVNIESMACGTPVIGINRGAMSEIIVDGKTGYLGHSVEELSQAVKNIDKLKRLDCRKHVEANFDSLHMAQNYLKVYEQLSEVKKSN